MAGPRTIENYATQLRILINNVRGAAGVVRVNPLSKNRKSGLVYADSLEFKDGGRLQFYESVEIDGEGNITRREYSLKYSRHDLSFQYDRDPDRAEPFIHPLSHLQIDGMKNSVGRDLRFPTHSSSFEEFFRFIAANFYTEEA